MTRMLFHPFCGIFAMTVSFIALRTGMFWRPLVWFGALIALGGLVAVTAPLQHDAEGVLTTVGYLALLAFLVWTVGVAASMMRAGRRQ